MFFTLQNKSLCPVRFCFKNAKLKLIVLLANIIFVSESLQQNCFSYIKINLFVQSYFKNAKLKLHSQILFYVSESL